MPALKCIIVDDEPLPVSLLSDYIRKIPFLQLSGAYHNPLEALAVIQEQQIDLILLDIQMPELNGLQFTKLTGEKTKIILTTAHGGFALEAFELNVVDYLIKPISFERFLTACTRALHTVFPPGHYPSPVLFVKSGYKLQRILVTDILFIEGLKEYIAIHTGSEKTVTLETIKKIESVLPAYNFVRVHKSFIVALDKIESIESNEIHIGKHIIPIGALYKESFFNAVRLRNLLGN